MFCAPVFSLILVFFSLSNFVISSGMKWNGNENVIISDSVLRALLIGWWCDIAPIEDKSLKPKNSFYEELEQLAAHFLMNFMFFQIQSWEWVPFVTLRWLLQRIEPGVTVISDCWAAYRDLDVQSYMHRGASHSIGFVDQRTEAHQHRRVHVAHTTVRGTTFTVTCSLRGVGQSRLTNSQGSFTSSLQWTGAPVPPTPRNPVLHDVLLVSGHLVRHLQPQVNARAHSSKLFVSKVISMCFLWPQNTTDLPWAWITCWASCHTCLPFYSSSN